ncbi:unnamed protein product [marine sediment metagenome]|uniref:Uncharacterized protein n=1 Tax=marine sediment metagenome TaxID=412755 RepID=X1L1F1_9ZZZZ
MAKLKAPLLSLGASGAIGKSLVYFPWKGLDVVREYVIPSNPRSSKQVTQRNLLADAVAEFHATGYDEDDMTAWALFASTFATPRTGFNAMVRAYVMQALGTGTWWRMHDVSVTPLAGGGATVTCQTLETVPAMLGCRYGYSKNSQPNSVGAASIEDGLATWTIPARTEGKEVYLFLSQQPVTYKDKTYYQGRTGLYHYTALAAE